MISLADIVAATAAEAGLRACDLVEAGRARKHSLFRDRAVLLARRLRPDFSTPFLGDRFGRHHTSILDSERRAADLIETNPAEAAAVAATLRRLGVDHLPPPPADALRVGNLHRELTFAEARVAKLRAEIAALTEDA